MKLYTKKGDHGQTELYSGIKVDKDALRVETFGTVDELNAAIGLAASQCDQPEITEVLRRTQGRLFELGWDLCTPRPKKSEKSSGGKSADERDDKAVRITAAHIAEAERDIDAACLKLPEMRTFILPGGTVLASRLHLARAICRRAERLCVALAKQEDLGEHLLIYVNRLSDLLFALARRANHLAGMEDVPWSRDKIEERWL